MSSYSVKPGAVRQVFQGMLLLACGRREGMQNFSGTVDAFGAALAPQLAFLLIGAFQALLAPGKALGMTKVLLSLCVVLLPAVVSQFYAKKWGKEDQWLRYITAATWSNWVVLLVTIAATVLAGLLFPALLSQPGFLKALLVVAAAYEIWLQWFVARAGLGVSGLRACVLYASILLVTFALYALAALLPPHYMVLADLMQSPVPVAAH
ncbi:MAG: hypothetical protein ACTINM_02165 [Acetobacter cibinongensis]